MKSNIFEVKASAWVITFAILITNHLSLIASTAQTFTQQVQKHHRGEGTVTIHHDADIDRLVNAATATAKPAAATAKPAATATKHVAAVSRPAAAAPKSAATASRPLATPKPAVRAVTAKATVTPKPEKSKAEKPKKPQEDTTRHKPLADTTRTTARQDSMPAAPDTTTIPAGPRHGYKTTGYRVQAFAGGNTRRDRQKAERTGNDMRQLFPGEDVYVRFYSPRWVCRVGNYRSYEEAHEKMVEIRKMGYESATIVKGKIVVYTNP